MTDDKKNEDKDRKKVSDEEMEDVAGGSMSSPMFRGTDGGTGKKKPRVSAMGTDGEVFEKPNKSGGGMDAVTTDPWDK